MIVNQDKRNDDDDEKDRDWKRGKVKSDGDYKEEKESSEETRKETRNDDQVASSFLCSGISFLDSLFLLVTFLIPYLFYFSSLFTKTESRTSFFGFFVGHVFNRHKTRE